MKRSTFLHSATLTLLAFVTLAACQAWAQNLRQPSGVAVDSKGILWVSNFDTNQILAFDTTYNLLPSKTITAGVVHPTGVAFDSVGNLYVANYGQTGYDSTVTVYGTNGKQITGRTISSNLEFANGIAVDSANDVLVNNGNQYMTMFSAYGTYLGTINPGLVFYTLASRGPWFAMGFDVGAHYYSTGEILENKVSAINEFPASRIEAIAFDSKNNFYAAQNTGEIDYGNTANAVASQFEPPSSDLQLTAMAVDNVRKRIFLCSYNNSKITVLSLSGQYITTIY